MPKGYFGKGVEDGFVTDIGKLQHMRHGLQRRNEYVKGKKFLSEEFNADELLSMSTFKQRCAVSGQFFLHGLYPLQDIAYPKEVLHQRSHLSPL